MVASFKSMQGLAVQVVELQGSLESLQASLVAATTQLEQVQAEFATYRSNAQSEVREGLAACLWA